MKHGDYALTEFKATDVEGDQPSGLFAALVSVFNTKDRTGDRIMPGAFTKTLEAWRERGDPIPVIWTHSHGEPDDYIGTVDPNDVRETKTGLVVAGKIDVEEPRGARIFALLKRRLVNNWSFAYQAKKAHRAKDGARIIEELDLFEVGPTLVGAHGGTMTLALKALDLDEDIDLDALEAELAAPGVETKLDGIVSEEFSEFETRVDALIEEKVGRVISQRTTDKIRTALDSLTSLLVEAGVNGDAASVESEEPEVSGEDETDEEVSVEDAVPEAASLSERDRLRLALADTDTFIEQRKR